MEAITRAVQGRKAGRMITISWDQLSEHIEKGDLKEWLNDARQVDKQRQFEEDIKGHREEGEQSDADLRGGKQ